MRYLIDGMRQIPESDVQQMPSFCQSVLSEVVPPPLHQDVTSQRAAAPNSIILLLVIVVRVGASQLEWRRMAKHQLDTQHLQALRGDRLAELGKLSTLFWWRPGLKPQVVMPMNLPNESDSIHLESFASFVDRRPRRPRHRRRHPHRPAAATSTAASAAAAAVTAVLAILGRQHRVERVEVAAERAAHRGVVETVRVLRVAEAFYRLMVLWRVVVELRNAGVVAAEDGQ